MMRPAFVRSFSPRAMANSGEPPEEISDWKAEMTVVTGNTSPRPVSASRPVSGMWPMYMRSTML